MNCFGDGGVSDFSSRLDRTFQASGTKARPISGETPKTLK
jgi:hypothetical protein